MIIGNFGWKTVAIPYSVKFISKGSVFQLVFGSFTYLFHYPRLRISFFPFFLPFPISSFSHIFRICWITYFFVFIQISFQFSLFPFSLKTCTLCKKFAYFAGLGLLQLHSTLLYATVSASLFLEKAYIKTNAHYIIFCLATFELWSLSVFIS